MGRSAAAGPSRCHELASSAGRVRETLIECGQGRIQPLYQRHVAAVADHHVVPKFPTPLSQQRVRPQLDAKVEQIGVHERGDIVRDVTAQRCATQDTGHFDGHEVRRDQFPIGEHGRGLVTVRPTVDECRDQHRRVNDQLHRRS